MNNLIIVESHNDKFFIEKLMDTMDLKKILVDEPICDIDDFECLYGLSEKKLKLTLNEIKFDKYNKVGIVIDADNEGIKNRIDLINKCINDEITKNFKITKINEFIRIDELDIEIGCYITNINGYGELETLLKTIKSEESFYADCLESWRNCLKAKSKEISDKDFDKFWINNYLRYDTCSKNEQKQAERKCKNEFAIKKDIWNFEDVNLNDLKTFLKLISR